MKHYELVCIIDAGLSSADISVLRKNIEKLLSIKEIDDMWLLPLSYPLNGQDQAYFLSYYVEMDEQNISEVKNELRLMKWLAKFVFYAMKTGEKFLKFADLQKRYEDLVSQEEERLNKSSQEEDEEETSK